MIDLRFIREYWTLWRTAGQDFVEHKGVRLSLRKASKRVRYYLFNGYEREDVELCDALLAPGDKVLEVGSAIGFVAIYCQKHLGIADYALVEANPGLLDVLHENFRLNGLPRPHVMNIAVGPQDGEATFHVSRDYFASSLNRRHVTVSTITVAQRTLPAIVASLPFRPNVLIMDIEGGEVDIAIADFALFDKIVIELHDVIAGAPAIARLVAALHEAGFELGGSNGNSRAFVRPVALAAVA